MLRLPERITYTNRIISPRKVQDLGSRLLALPCVTAEKRFDHTLGIESVRPGESLRIPLGCLSKEIFADDPIGSQLIVAVGRRALGYMNGLGRGGLPSGYAPRGIRLSVNHYRPGDELPTHSDAAASNDAVSVTLFGDEAIFMHVSALASTGEMPRPDQVLTSWQMSPGDAVAIQNHDTAREGGARWPLYAVRNGDGRCLTLGAQVFYAAA